MPRKVKDRYGVIHSIEVWGVASEYPVFSLLCNPFFCFDDERFNRHRFTDVPDTAATRCIGCITAEPQDV